MYNTENLKNLSIKLLSKVSELENSTLRNLLWLQEKALSICETSELIALEARKLPLSVGVSDVHEVNRVIANALDVKINIEGDVVSITIPTLLPKKMLSSAFAKYIGDSLNTAFITYARIHPGCIKKYKEKVLLIQENCYENSYPEKYLRDHDNIEKKVAIDCIVAFFLIDDSTSQMSNFTYSTRGDVSYTKFTIVPQNKAYKHLKDICVFDSI